MHVEKRRLAEGLAAGLAADAAEAAAIAAQLAAAGSAPFAARLMNCGGPSIIAAMARLRAIRQNVGRQGVGA